MESVWAQYLHVCSECDCLSQPVLTVPSSLAGGIVMYEAILRSDLTFERSDIFNNSAFSKAYRFLYKGGYSEFGCRNTDTYHSPSVFILTGFQFYTVA